MMGSPPARPSVRGSGAAVLVGAVTPRRWAPPARPDRAERPAGRPDQRTPEVGPRGALWRDAAGVPRSGGGPHGAMRGRAARGGPAAAAGAGRRRGGRRAARGGAGGAGGGPQGGGGRGAAACASEGGSPPPPKRP